MGECTPEDNARQVYAINVYTQLHKWLPEVNKQKFTHPPTMLQVGVAIGGVAVEAKFVH